MSSSNLSSSIHARAVAALLALATVGSVADARAEKFDRFGAELDIRVDVVDDDPNARVELRGADGVVIRCSSGCEVPAPGGHFHVRIRHGDSDDETDAEIVAPTTLRGRTSDYTGVGVGVPLIALGATTALLSWAAYAIAGTGDYADAPNKSYYEDKADRQRAWAAVIGTLGCVGILGGIGLIATSHGSSVKAEPWTPHLETLHVAAVPVAGGGVFALSGTF